MHVDDVPVYLGSSCFSGGSSSLVSNSRSMASSSKSMVSSSRSLNGIVASCVSTTDGDYHAALVVVVCDALRICIPLVFVDPEISTQADGAQSSRVPVPLPEDPYEAIRHAYLDGMDIKSEPFEDPVETETPESPHIVAPPTLLPESTPPTLVPILRKTARMALRVPPAMSLGLSASMVEVAAMSKSAFLEDDEEDDDEEDKEIEESLDFDSVSEDAKDEGPTAEDEDLASGDEGLAAGDEGPDKCPQFDQTATIDAQMIKGNGRQRLNEGE
ncbi:hypothetical protein Tco_1401027 [Tanacetum coccineum]